ncbi:MAG: DUF6673 family protein [Ruthenibacterium sp.]
MTVQGQQIDFDITAPEDLQRYSVAMAQMQTDVNALKPSPDMDLTTPEGVQAYAGFITAQCRILTDFIDSAFGEGVCNRMLGKKSSLAKLNALCAELGAALAQQGTQSADSLRGYTPNRRRAAQGGDAHEPQNA